MYKSYDGNDEIILRLSSSGSESMKIRVYRAVIVCLGLLCVLLAALIVLFVLINVNNHQCHNKNPTEERDHLLTKDINHTEEADQLLTNNTNLTDERDQLLTDDTNLTEEINVIFRNKNLTYDKDKLIGEMKNLQMFLGKVGKYFFDNLIYSTVVETLQTHSNISCD